MSQTPPPRLAYVSGQLLPEDDAKISIFDSAVMLGNAVTESTRTFAGQPFRLEEHIRRLYRSLKVARINPGMTQANLLETTLEVFEANRPLLKAGDDVWIVHNISAGVSIPGSNPQQSHSATIMIFTAHLDLRGWAKFYREGCHAVTSMSRMIPSQALDARIKNRSRMAYTLADSETRLVDPDAQCVILDIHGFVAENKGGNIFAVRDGELLTPTSENCLEGLSRQTVLELAGKLGIPARETRLLPYDLYTADEVFFTSTPYCIMPATKFNGLPVGDGQVGPMTKSLLQAWSELAGVNIVAQALAQLG